AMPAFHLPDSELREIVAHVRFIAGATSSASAEIGAVSSGEFTAVVSPPRDPTTGLQFIPEKWKGGSVSQPSRLALRIQDYLTMPMTGVTESHRSNDALLARINFLREEPGGAGRFFVNDLNGPLYILDKKTRKLTTYLDFDGRKGRKGLFRKFTTEDGYANGFINFVFDPDYRRNGKFYTLHLEELQAPASPLPDTANFPG